MKSKYVIDTCSLITFFDSYNITKKAFKGLWDIIENLYDEGRLFSTTEVKDEIRDKDILDWVKDRNNFFIKPNEEIQKEVIKILKDFPQMIKMTSVKNSNADPFLIATAHIYNATVVTDENRSLVTTSRAKIPNVCYNYGIKCIGLHEFIDEILD